MDDMRYVNTGDRSGSVAPGDAVLCNGVYSEVIRVVINPPHSADHGCIVADMFAVKIVTTNGVRWTGGTVARINGDLRVHWSR